MKKNSIGQNQRLLKNIQRSSHFVSMKVSTNQPFKIVYSLLEHEYLGFLFEPYVVQVNSKGELTMQLQSVSSKNIVEFSSVLDSIDFELVKLTDAIQQDVVMKKFNQKKLQVYDFFSKTFDANKGDKLLQEAIMLYVENIRVQILDRILSRDLFVMGADGNPIWHKVSIQQQKAKVYFHFNRQEDGSTNYFPIIRHNGERVLFQHRNARTISDEVAWLLVDDKLFHFEKNVDGKKLKPFLNKNHIVIPPALEETYYRKFVANLIASFDVYANGFEIIYENHDATPILQLTENVEFTAKSPSFFGNETPEEEQPEDTDSRITFDLLFQYNGYTFRFDSFAAEANVNIEKNENGWIFKKVKRDLNTERSKVNFLKDKGLEIKHGRATLPKTDAFIWLQKNAVQLSENDFKLKQHTETTKKYFLGYSTIEMQIVEKNDWFDVEAIVKFGEYEIPFKQLRTLILAKKREFTLPNGEIAVIPEEWFAQYLDFLLFTEENEDGLVLRKHHLTLVQNLEEDGLARAIINRRLSGLKDFVQIEDQPLPTLFTGTLRPYQKAGYNWMRFLSEYKLGGCLADDMGLGKTIQSLAFIQSLKEIDQSEHPTLIVMPTSLIYNWQNEAEKFTPNLKVFIHSGTQRAKSIDFFANYDVILMSYGVLRLDIDFIKNFRFDYVLLDESQAIKNPSSIVAKAVMQLNAGNRLILTGTPLENSLLDLWSQMTFINPGLLGGQTFFKSQYLNPIERNQDENKTKKLQSIVKPFMLRRHKSQVATELPAKVENVLFCNMTEEQERVYEEVKSQYRNIILASIEEHGLAKAQFTVLQGLTKLRQIANHPFMADEAYEGDSGKFSAIFEKLESVVEANHKVLVFSQFVKHLDLFRNELDSNGIKYCYLDGSTTGTGRQDQVDTFQNDESVKVFLISLKAGGVGINLTAAEYVFLLDPWWNPAVEAQAVDRAHRIGQQNTVFTYKFISKHTVEEKILSLQKHKQKLFTDLIATEETFVKSLSQDDILSLLD
jgi:SNF2 family DNA or RNA helicase